MSFYTAKHDIPLKKNSKIYFSHAMYMPAEKTNQTNTCPGIQTN